jgi:hypothetical protein
MHLASTTDTAESVTAAINGNGEDGREAQTQFELEQQLDGSSAVAFEHPASERSLLLERLRLEELEADQLIGPEDEVETVDALGEVRDEPVAPAEEEPEAIQAQESAQPVAQPNTTMEFQLGKISAWNPEGVEALRRSTLQVPQAVLAELASEPAGTVAAVIIAQNPELSDRLMKIPAPQAAREIREFMGRIKHEAAQQAASAQQEQPAPRRAVSQAPAPIKPLGGGNTKSSLPMDQMNFQDYKRARAAQVKSRYGSR